MLSSYWKLNGGWDMARLQALFLLAQFDKLRLLRLSTEGIDPVGFPGYRAVHVLISISSPSRVFFGDRVCCLEACLEEEDHCDAISVYGLEPHKKGEGKFKKKKRSAAGGDSNNCVSSCPSFNERKRRATARWPQFEVANLRSSNEKLFGRKSYDLQIGIILR
ncbi:hypothetical protein M9H77_16964 [Catharanthus roseus]|uniref:Uncharacterized protein n=1 Tax=Catharanthus roseus TaxID=4058 RepID=A0ACC0B378_CATRO|nr:hypothetical protein M9H77_16964 [Catharanthus roseus]